MWHSNENKIAPTSSINQVHPTAPPIQPHLMEMKPVNEINPYEPPPPYLSYQSSNFVSNIPVENHVNYDNTNYDFKKKF